MSTAEMETSPAEVYRAAVFAGEQPDAGALVDAGKLSSDWRADAAVYRKRREADVALTSGIPAMQAELSAAQAAVARAPRWGNRSPAEFPTIADLAHALQEHAAGSLPPESLRVHELTGAIRTAQADALRVLRETADPAIERRQSALRQTAAEIQGRIDAARKLLAIDERIARQRAVCEGVASGKPLSEIFAYPVGQERSKVLAHQRTLLDELMQQASGKEAARAEIARLEENLADVGREQAALEAAKMNPERMAWSGEQR